MERHFFRLKTIEKMKNKPNYCLLTVLEDKVNQTNLSLKVKQVVHFQAGGASGLLYVIR